MELHRRLVRPRAPTQCGRKRGAFGAAIGLSRGGRTTKLHARVDATGKPLQVTITPGNIHDCTEAPRLIAEATTTGAIIGDKGYDSDALIAQIEAKSALAVIPPKSNRKTQRDWAKSLYKERNVVERFFNRLKQYRGIATRYEKTAESFLALVHLACARMWLL